MNLHILRMQWVEMVHTYHSKVTTNLRIHIRINPKQHINLLASNSWSYNNILQVKLTININKHTLLCSQHQILQKLPIPIKDTPVDHHNEQLPQKIIVEQIFIFSLIAGSSPKTVWANGIKETQKFIGRHKNVRHNITWWDQIQLEEQASAHCH